MARPRKQGMDYFPHDCDARNDLKIRKLRALYGNDGYAVYFILLENIYKEKHYELEVLDGETPLILAEECKVTLEKFKEVLNKCLELNLFDKQLYEERKIITSSAIKIRTEPVEIERNRKRNLRQNIDNDTVIPGETTGQSAQRKEKERESKVKESKERVNENSQALSRYVEKITCGKWFIAKETDKLNVFIEMYTFDWVKDAVNEAAKKNKYSMNYVEGILRTWTKEGKEESHGGTRANNAEGQGKFAGIKPPEPNISGDIDTTDII
jgi:DnaD/phage-associated family protein